jgi:hypothetical protein
VTVEYLVTCNRQVEAYMQAATMSKRRQVRLREEHDQVLESIARRRGCDVVDLFREAIIAHFNLPTEENQTFVEQAKTATDGRLS